MKRVVFATTGDSFILKSLLKDPSIQVVGIVDFKTGRNDEAIPHYSFENMDSLGKLLNTLKPDVLAVYKMPFLLPEHIFTIPRYGSINIHPSLLPKYRGPNPWFWTYYNMETVGGITIHRIDQFEDHGEILAQRSFEIKWGDELHQLQLKAEQSIYPDLSAVLSNIDVVEGTPQTSVSRGSRAPNVADYSSLINLKKMDKLQIWHLLRGFPELKAVIDGNGKISKD